MDYWHEEDDNNLIQGSVTSTVLDNSNTDQNIEIGDVQNYEYRKRLLINN